MPDHYNGADDDFTSSVDSFPVAWVPNKYEDHPRKLVGEIRDLDFRERGASYGGGLVPNCVVFDEDTQQEWAVTGYHEALERELFKWMPRMSERTAIGFHDRKDPSDLQSGFRYLVRVQGRGPVAGGNIANWQTAKVRPGEMVLDVTSDADLDTSPEPPDGPKVKIDVTDPEVQRRLGGRTFAGRLDQSADVAAADDLPF